MLGLFPALRACQPAPSTSVCLAAGGCAVESHALHIKHARDRAFVSIRERIHHQVTGSETDVSYAVAGWEVFQRQDDKGVGGAHNLWVPESAVEKLKDRWSAGSAGRGRRKLDFCSSRLGLQPPMSIRSVRLSVLELQRRARERETALFFQSGAECGEQI